MKLLKKSSSYWNIFEKWVSKYYCAYIGITHFFRVSYLVCALTLNTADSQFVSPPTASLWASFWSRQTCCVIHPTASARVCIKQTFINAPQQTFHRPACVLEPAAVPMHSDYIHDCTQQHMLWFGSRQHFWNVPFVPYPEDFEIFKCFFRHQRQM